MCDLALSTIAFALTSYASVGSLLSTIKSTKPNISYIRSRSHKMFVLAAILTFGWLASSGVVKAYDNVSLVGTCKI